MSPDTSLSLYLHIPFCDHRCAYCDFNAYAGLNSLMPRYTDALVREVELWAERLGPRAVATVFFGGGTPSLLPLPLLERVIAAIHAGFRVATDAEWTLEANPGTVDEAYFRGLQGLGVNRVSIGVQSFDDTELCRLDRIHDGAAAVAAYRAARAAGFDNLSLDLIYGLEGQDLAGWARNLDRALALGPEHLSLYALTIEEGTPLAHRVARGQAPAPDPDLQADMYALAQARLAMSGYEQYEISNWALPGRACRHNLVYWRDGEWLGLGAGAHSHLHGHRFAVMNSPAGYVRRVFDRHSSLPTRSGGVRRVTGDDRAAMPADRCEGPEPSPPHPSRTAASLLATEKWHDGVGVKGNRPPWIVTLEAPDHATAMADAAIMSLRLSEGLSLTSFAARFGVRFETRYPRALHDCLAFGLLVRDDDRLRIPAEKRLLASEVFARILAEGSP